MLPIFRIFPHSKIKSEIFQLISLSFSCHFAFISTSYVALIVFGILLIFFIKDSLRFFRFRWKNCLFCGIFKIRNNFQLYQSLISNILIWIKLFNYFAFFNLYILRKRCFSIEYFIGIFLHLLNLIFKRFNFYSTN